MANLYDKAGLVNIPVGYQDGFLYNIKPEDNTLGFRFNRDSAATRVNKEGLIEQVGYFGPELVKNGNFSELGSELIPDGNFTNQAAVDYWQIANTGGVPRATKSLENGFMRLTYDLAIGAALFGNGIVTSGKSYKVTFRAKGTANSNFNSIGDNANIPSNTQYVVSNPTLTDDWQDYEFYVPVSSTAFRLYLTSAQIGDTLDITNISVKQVDPNDYWNLGTGWSMGDDKAVFTSGISGILFQSNIVETGKLYKLTFDVIRTSGFITSVFLGGVSDSTDINKSGSYIYYITSINQDVLGFNANSSFNGSITNISVTEVLGDKPRIDYTDSLTSPSFLLEPQTTNLVTYSEDFSKSNWSKTGLTVSSNQIISPDGSLNADEINITGANAHFLFEDISVNASTNYVLTFYAKKGTATDVSYSIYDSSNGADIIASTSYYSQISNTNWTRITVEFTTPSGCTSARPYPLRDGSSTGTVYIWGAQLEEKSYATSYIPTAGSTATRAEETCNGAGNASTFNDSEGVLYAEIAALADDLTFRLLSLSDGTSSNSIVLGFRNLSNIIYIAVRSQSSTVLTISYSTSDITKLNKIAFKYQQNNFSLYVNGVEVQSITSGNVPIGLDRLNFDVGNGGDDFYGNVKSVVVFNEALTDDELQQLTGPEYNSFAALAAAYNYTVI